MFLFFPRYQQTWLRNTRQSQVIFSKQSDFLKFIYLYDKIHTWRKTISQKQTA